ncbi:MAG: family transcriptional regulator [Rhodococcus erythropolis]|nr:family transcriptional regulator [Rhodococcus erythropolis]
MVGRATDENVFQLRLNELFSGSDRRLTNTAVANGLLARGYRISTPYLSQLRHGVRSSPSDEVVSALADSMSLPAISSPSPGPAIARAFTTRTRR